jgi:hypothetical protein
VTTFTPGPWIAHDNGSSVYTEAPVDPGRCYGYGCGPAFVCDLNDGEYHEYSDSAEQVANARLIAAAPDMYEALKAIRAEQAEGYCCDATRAKADAALAKAEAQS